MLLFEELKVFELCAHDVEVVLLRSWLPGPFEIGNLQCLNNGQVDVRKLN